jgi:hypothetical protein
VRLIDDQKTPTEEIPVITPEMATQGVSWR